MKESESFLVTWACFCHNPSLLVPLPFLHEECLNEIWRIEERVRRKEWMGWGEKLIKLYFYLFSCIRNLESKRDGMSFCDVLRSCLMDEPCVGHWRLKRPSLWCALCLVMVFLKILQCWRITGFLQCTIPPPESLGCVFCTGIQFFSTNLQYVEQKENTCNFSSWGCCMLLQESPCRTETFRLVDWGSSCTKLSWSHCGWLIGFLPQGSLRSTKYLVPGAFCPCYLGPLSFKLQWKIQAVTSLKEATVATLMLASLAVQQTLLCLITRGILKIVELLQTYLISTGKVESSHRGQCWPQQLHQIQSFFFRRNYNPLSCCWSFIEFCSSL